MLDQPERQSSLFRRLTANPRRLRLTAALSMVLLATAFGATRAINLGFPGSLLAALCWVFGPVAAFGMAAGDAFFLQFGRGLRRVVLTIIVAAAVTLGACAGLVVVTDESQDTAQRVLEGALYALLLGAVLFGLAALLAVGIGRTGDYLTRRIDALSNDDW